VRTWFAGGGGKRYSLVRNGRLIILIIVSEGRKRTLNVHVSRRENIKGTGEVNGQIQGGDSPSGGQRIFERLENHGKRQGEAGFPGVGEEFLLWNRGRGGLFGKEKEKFWSWAPGGMKGGFARTMRPGG